MDIPRGKYLHWYCTLMLCLQLGGCFTSIVKKPEIDQVKRVAILSLYADQKVPSDKGTGIVKDWDDKVRLQVADDALNTYRKALSTLGWQVVNPQKVLESREYQQAFKVSDNKTVSKVASFLQNVYQQQFFTPPGMLPIVLSDEVANTRYYGDAKQDNPVATLAGMAKKLNVDAVVLVQMDYCYTGGTFSLLGSGQAVMSAGASVKAINQKGDVVVNMPTVPRCDGKRGESKTSAIMLAGNLQFTRADKDRFRKMFIEATRESAMITVGELQKAMSKK